MKLGMWERIPFQSSIFLNKHRYYPFSQTFLFYKSPYIHVPPWMFGAELVRRIGSDISGNGFATTK